MCVFILFGSAGRVLLKVIYVISIYTFYGSKVKGLLTTIYLAIPNSSEAKTKGSQSPFKSIGQIIKENNINPSCTGKKKLFRILN